MRSSMLMVFALLLAGNVVFAQAPMSNDEAEIKSLVQQLVDGILKKQPSMMGEVLADDVVFITPSGHLLTSKTEVVGFHEEALKMMPPNYTFEVTVKNVRFIQPDLATAQIDGKGSFEMNGKSMLDEQSAGITAVKANGAWKIIHFGATPVQRQ